MTSTATVPTPHHRHHRLNPPPSLPPSLFFFFFRPDSKPPTPKSASGTLPVMFSGEAPKRRGGPGLPWLDAETAHLIDAYEEKWCALRRGQLKANQWEEVAAAVASRLGLARPSKNGTQCRHKIEKLRQRYRAERRRSAPSRWAFFDRMDRMERGPLPISIRPPLLLPPPPPLGDEIDDDDDDDEEIAGDGAGSGREDTDLEEGEEEEEEDNGGNTVEENGRYPRISIWSVYEEEEEGGKRAVRELAAVVSGFREGFARLEKRRLELMTEMEREWMEMEAKRAEMVAESQRRLVDGIPGAFRFDSTKKTKKAVEM